MSTSRKRRLAATAIAAALSLTVAACSSDSGGNTVGQQANKGGFEAGDGSIQQLSAGERGKPVNLSGTLLDGKKWTIADAAGKVVVLNVWGSWCGPCQDEMPHLQSAWASWQKAGDPVLMLGIVQRDSNARASAMLRRFNATYPNLADDGGQTLLALQGKVTLTPTTLVLDKQHRIAARVTGAVSEATVKGLVQDALKS